MTVLVTGGAGFIGSHVAEYYARAKEQVVVLDNLSRSRILGKRGISRTYNWKYLSQYKKLRRIVGDVTRMRDVLAASEDAETIVHTAAQVAVTTSLTDPELDFKLNVLGTFNVLEAARKNDSSVIFSSSNKVYGENVNKIPVSESEKRYSFADESYSNGIPEDFPVDHAGHSPYGCSKLAGDLYVQEYSHTYGLKTGVFRMSCIYGERQFGVEDQGWVAWFVIASLSNKKITIYGDGKQVRDVLHVSDLVKLFDTFIRSDLKQVVANVGGGPKNTLSLLELLEILRNQYGKTPNVEFADWRAADQKVYISDISKCGKILGWAPTVTPSEGVLRLGSWVTENLSLFK